MKTYGKLSIEERKESRWWVFRCVPHVNMRLKAVFARVDKGQFGEVRLRYTPETCLDVEWFCSRYPLEMSREVRRAMENGAEAHEENLKQLEVMLRADYTPRSFPMAKPLRDYQARAVEVYLNTRGLLLGDHLGLGKTVSAIGSFAAGETLPALVVCPTHLARQWQEFLAVFLPGASTHIVKQTKPYGVPFVDIVIITYSKLAAWGDEFSVRGFKSVVFDEIQELRHHTSQKYKAAQAIRDGCAYGLGLSATPIYNYGGEIYNILQITAPGRIGGRDEFYREWCTFRGNDRWLINDPMTFGEYLRDQFLMLRRRREDVGLELPQVERTVITVPHNADVLKEVESATTELARLVLQGTFLESGQASRELDAKLRQATGVAKAPFVADFVRMLVENGEKVLLFGWHREVYEVWMERLEDLSPVLYTGTESPNQKEEAVRRFRTFAKVMIMSLRSGSGVDGLQQVCSTCVFGELDWSPGVHEQCVGRLNRDGLTGGVNSYFLVSDAGSDPVIASVLGLKQSQAVGIVDPDKATDIEALQTDTQRVKKLAADWLSRRGVKIEQ